MCAVRCSPGKRGQMKITNYFRTSVIVRRPDIKIEWIEYVLSNPIRTEILMVKQSITPFWSSLQTLGEGGRW